MLRVLSSVLWLRARSANLFSWDNAKPSSLQLPVTDADPILNEPWSARNKPRRSIRIPTLPTRQPVPSCVNNPNNGSYRQPSALSFFGIRYACLYLTSRTFPPSALTRCKFTTTDAAALTIPCCNKIGNSNGFSYQDSAKERSHLRTMKGEECTIKESLQFSVDRKEHSLIFGFRSSCRSKTEEVEKGYANMRLDGGEIHGIP